MTSFDDMVRTCTKGAHGPYEYQRVLAREGLPELLAVPTGCGKTMAVVLGWLYRRRFHPDPAVRAGTPHWLVICQPMRTLVEQVERNVHEWLAELDLDRTNDADGVDVHVFMGGEPTKRTEWRDRAERDAIVIGTQDMLLSRSLNRGFGSSRYLWPVEFGVLNSGCHWVYDEVQLMGAGVPTGRQLQAFRNNAAALLPSGSTWMSATPDENILATVDNPIIQSRIELTEVDRSGPLSKRLNAEKVLRELHLGSDPKNRPKQLAAAVLQGHVPGTLTIVVVNTVAGAQQVHEHLQKAKPEAGLLLVHSRFRRPDRQLVVRRLLDELEPAGRIVVSTQVIEAGIDLDATTLFTEAAPWSSIVQRLGRCNRAGSAHDAAVWWFSPEKPEKPSPYESADVLPAIEMLRSLEAQAVVPDGLACLGPAPAPKLLPVLRSKDLLALFDTAPEVGGADIDVSPYVRDLDDAVHALLAWRPAPDPKTERRPTQNELCPAPLGKALTAWLKDNRALRFDLIERNWVRHTGEPRPNQIFLLDSIAGGYSPTRGVDLAITAMVPAIDPEPSYLAELEEVTEDDTATFDQPCGFVSLSTHLLDAEREAGLICDGFGIQGSLRVAVVASARRHDIGKAHDVFQATMDRSAKKAAFATEGLLPLAKARGRERHSRRNFRHELASALALLGDASIDLDDVAAEFRFLVVYLTAAHHGRVRMSLRAMPKDEEGCVFGIRDGEVLPAVAIGDHIVPPAALTPSRYIGVGLSSEGDPPWRERVEHLLDAHGPFTLALLESLVRLADWKASSRPGVDEQITTPSGANDA